MSFYRDFSQKDQKNQLTEEKFENVISLTDRRKNQAM